MQKLLSCLLLLVFFLQNSLLAQEPDKMQLAPCGTAPGLDPWLREYLARPDVLQFRSDDTLYVAMKIHLLAKDNGTGRFSTDRLLSAFCRLNEDFAPSKIKFFFQGDWNLLNSTAWYDHNDIETGIDMMLTNKVPDAINAYFVADPAGNCGYNLPYGGVAIGHSCANPTDHTWTHEVGHALAMPHPFIGWEGKIYNFNTPTPTMLTYDYTHFHAQPDTIVPAPLDTALVELVDGSNCLVAADKFCGTTPDYLAYRWDCDAQNMSTVKQKDPNGAEFFSDGSYFMGYALDHCQSRFSDDEIAAMRANLQTVKATYLAPAAVAQPIAGLVELLEPIGGQTVPSDGAYLRWSAVPGATKYLLQGSRLQNYAFRDFEVVVSDTTWLSGQLLNNTNYYWRVRPFNDVYTCETFTGNGKFFAANVTSTHDWRETKGWRLYPSLAEPGSILTVETIENLRKTALCRIVSASGEIVSQAPVYFSGEKTRLPLPTENLVPGVYQAVFIFKDAVWASPFLIAGE